MDLESSRGLSAELLRDRRTLRRPAGVELPPVQPTVFAAADVPRLRDRLLESWKDGTLATLFAVHTDFRLPWHYAAGRRVREWTLAEYHHRLLRWLAEAELFFVTSDMTSLVRQAADAMPNYEVNTDTMPARVGFAVFADAMCEVGSEVENDLRAGERCAIQAALWAHADTIDGPGVHLVTVQLTDVMVNTRESNPQTVLDLRRVLGPLSYHEDYSLPFGNRPFGETSENRAVKNTAVGGMMSCWLLMSQRLTDVPEAVLPRSVRRAATRQGRPEPKVRQVVLRRSPAQQRQESSQSTRVYTKQWPVKGYGYWRNTWYPSKQEHRQQFVYVPSYMKGPEGAPMVGGERVNVLRR